jgi:small subunit ribosomal protein S16
MAVKIRLTRLGKKKQPTYRVVVMDSRKPRDGEYIEQLGFYDPKQNPSIVEINNERALYWLRTGAQPTERAQKLLEISGAWTQFRVAKGDIHTIGADEPQAASEPEAVVVEATEEVAVPEDPAAVVVADTVEDVAEATAEEAVDTAAEEAAAETIEETEAIESSEES